ncbi:MAG TPA: carboxypeptidase regulatory-like domain-containing protein, partial [Candidatus Syntrophosphaera sp.]|nr:carboxypeptidase regulatory-like domain-containing protein [Candidatus Syntrophosphaera sp.]
MKKPLLFTLLLIFVIGMFSNVYAQVNVTIGTGTSTNTETGVPAPYGTWYKSFRQQFLLLATEIEDAGGGAGNINSVAFNVANLNTCSPMPNYTIRLKHTTQTSLSTTFEVGDYQTVYTQAEFMPVVGWNTHTFSTPFVWDGTSNILVDICTTLVTGNYTRNASVYYSSTTFNSALRYQSDNSDAGSATTGTTGTNRSNVRFNMESVVVTDPPNPAQIVSPLDGAVNVMTSATLNWASGGGVPSGYKVHFGTTNPPPFIQNTTETDYAPTNMELTTTYYWQIIPFNVMGDATNCPVWSFTTGGPVVLMSNGTQNVPDGMTYSFYDSGGPDGNYQSSENYTFTFTATNPSSIIHVLFTEFHTESGWDFLKVYNGPDTSAPQIGPAAGYTGTTLPEEIIGSNAVTFVFTSDSSYTYSGWSAAVSAVDLQHDLGAQSISGNTTPSVNSPSTYTVAVKNNGANTENTYTVKLMGTGDVELASIPGTTIAPQQTIDFGLTWTPTAPGAMQIWGKVVLADDGIATNNQTLPLNVTVQQEGIVAVTIGDGSETARIPVDFFWKNSLCETIYPATDMNIGGLITGVQYYNDFTNANGLMGKPTKIWMGEIADTDLSGGWVPSTSLTSVFDGNVDYPTGQNDINITLQTPYVYSGGNLVVLVQRPMDTDWFSGVNFLAQTIGNARCLNVYSDNTPYDPASPPSNTTPSGQFPKTTFFLVVDDMGALTGTVRDANNVAMPGATVSISGTPLTTITDASGVYNFPYVAMGPQTVVATKHGYNVVSHNVTIIEDETVTQDFVLTQLPQVTVTGRIVGSDQPTVGLADAIINLTGYEPYQATTNANGQFTITGVYASQTYDYTAQAVGYQAATGQAVVGTTDLNMGDITVNELAFPPCQVVATEAADYSHVTVTWMAPDPNAQGISEDFEEYEDFSLTFDPWVLVDVDQSGTYGMTGYTWPNVYSPMAYMIFNPSAATPPVTTISAHSGNKMAACFASTDAVNNDWLISPPMIATASQFLNFYARSYIADYGLERFKVGISTGGTAPADFTIISGPNYIQAPIEWTLYSYDLSAYAGQNIRFGIQCVSDDAFYFVVDDVSVGPVPTAKEHYASAPSFSSRNTDTQSFSTSSIVTRSIGNAASVSRNVGASHVNNPRIQVPAFQMFTPSNSDRVLGGYKVYRLLADNQDNESLWTQLTPNTITPTNYTDNAWAPLPSGVYKYAVKAVYTNNVMSPAAFSGEIHKGMMGTLTGTVTEFGTNVPIAGATITAGDYSGTSDASGHYSFGVYQGTYTVTCSKVGYQAASQAGVSITGLQTTTQNFVLTEITLPPGGVQAVEASSSLVNVTWMEPGTGGGEWIYYDSGENDDSIGLVSGGEFSVAIRFPPSALTDYAGMSLHAISLFPGDVGTYSLRVWTGGTASAPATQVVDQPFTVPTVDTFQTVVLDNPVLVSGTEELWFGYNVVHASGAYPAGCDAGPANNGFGNMIYNSGEWATLTDLAPSLNYNWNIRGYVGYSAPDDVCAIDPSIIKYFPSDNIKASKDINASKDSNRVLNGYKVWRLLQGQENNESAWVQLTTDVITATAWQDDGWGNVPDGNYKWAVKAIYTGGAASTPAFSTVVPKQTQIGTIAGIVRSQQNAPIMGATVTCGDVSATTNASGAYSMQVVAGT